LLEELRPGHAGVSDQHELVAAVKIREKLLRRDPLRVLDVLEDVLIDAVVEKEGFELLEMLHLRCGGKEPLAQLGIGEHRSARVHQKDQPR